MNLNTVSPELVEGHPIIPRSLSKGNFAPRLGFDRLSPNGGRLGPDGERESSAPPQLALATSSFALSPVEGSLLSLSKAGARVDVRPPCFRPFDQAQDRCFDRLSTNGLVRWAPGFIVSQDQGQPAWACQPQSKGTR
jgi:hypothetical protein